MIKGLLASLMVCGLALAAPFVAFAQEPTAAEATHAAPEATTPGAPAPVVEAEVQKTEAHAEAVHEAAVEHGKAAEHDTEHGAASHEAGAHEAGAHHATEIPMSVLFQVINFVLFVGLLAYFLRKPIKTFFGGREEAYNKALKHAEIARLDAEKKRKEVQDRLQALESGSKNAIESARTEAAAMLVKMNQDAKELAERLRIEAGRTAEVEVARAKDQLRAEVLAQSIELSRKMLTDKMAEGDQKRLQTEFVDKIQEVR